jgi:hypothetical protein
MLRSHALDKLAGGLAAAFLAGDWNEAGLVRRGHDAVQPPPRWMRRLAAEVLAHYHRPPLDRPRELARFIELQLGPQGAPTSPALANLAAFRLDRRLAGLAAKLGAVYTRYADDLVLSGPHGLGPSAARLAATAAEIAHEEGFRLNHAKTRAMGRCGRQQVCGIVVNEHTNAPRREYDELKAILHNAARRGPEGENRAGHPDFRAHLLGRIAWVEQLNPGRGRKLRERFARIDWGG